MMMMPVFPGAPWVPTFTGTESDLKYGEWKEQMQGRLEAQEVPETKGVKLNSWRATALHSLDITLIKHV